MTFTPVDPVTPIGAPGVGIAQSITSDTATPSPAPLRIVTQI